MPRHVPPSRIRYEKKNPKVTVRLTESLKVILDEIRDETPGLSYADLVKKGLTTSANEAEAYQKGYCEAETEAYQKGYYEASEKFQIWFPCFICRKSILIKPNSKTHKAILEYLKRADWGHVECVRERRRRHQY